MCYASGTENLSPTDLDNNNPSVTFGDSSPYTREAFFCSIYFYSVFVG